MPTDGVSIHWGLRIPLRDGVEAAATLYMPSAADSAGVAIVALTPYVAQSCHDVAMYFATNGFPFVAVDVRGRGNSGGTFFPGPAEADDAHDIVEWIGAQRFSGGRVAMWGGSYGGYLQWAAAKTFPKSLVSMVPVASPYRAVDSPMRNNLFAPYRVQWLTLVAGLTAQDRIFGDQSYWNRRFRDWFVSGGPLKELDEFLGIPSPIFQEWIRHPNPDAYWDRCNPTAEEYAHISLPILTITGVYDTNQQGALSHYRRHRERSPGSRHFLVIGPWDHAGTRLPQLEFGGLRVGAESLLDLRRLHIEWYGWTTKGGPKPAFLRKPVAHYVIGADRWRYAETLDTVTSRSMPLYLHSNGDAANVFASGRLGNDPPANGPPDLYRYDPTDVAHADIEAEVHPWSLTDQRMVHALAGKRLVYHSAPFDADTEIAGFFRFVCWLSIDQPDTDFSVSVYEIAIDGLSLLLSTDLMRARYRESFRAPKPVVSHRPLLYNFERFTFVSHLIRKGSRLRLVFGPVNSIFLHRSFNSDRPSADESIRDSRVVTVALHHDADHPSVLFVPLGHADA